MKFSQNSRDDIYIDALREVLERRGIDYKLSALEMDKYIRAANTTDLLADTYKNGG